MAVELSSRIVTEIRAEMARQRMENPDLAERIHVAPSTVWRWMTGRSKVGLDDLDAIAKALNVSIPDLLSRAGGAGPNGGHGVVDLRRDTPGGGVTEQFSIDSAHRRLRRREARVLAFTSSHPSAKAA